MGTPSLQSKTKKLRRLPHVFSKVLELPLNSEADVSVEEHPDCFRFVAKGDCLGDVSGGLKVKAHTVEVHPGVKKVVVRRGGGGGVGGNFGLLIDELELDMWRYRLPANASPEAAKAVCRGGELVVTVPKCGGVTGVGGGKVKKGLGSNERGRGNMGNLVLAR